MHWLLEIVNQQWLYQNATVHMKLEDGMTKEQHLSILARIEECLEIDLGDLQEKNQSLLHADFEWLVTGLAKDKVEWIAVMESAMGAAKHVTKGSRQTLHARYCTGSCPWTQIEYEAVLVDGEGSMWWRRQRKQS
jgi:hypothetical protein